MSCVSFDTHDLNNKIMPRATGPIGYIEHRSPRKDENGKYIIHPQFVQKEMYDAEKMAHDSQGRCMTNGAQFVSVMDTILESAFFANTKYFAENLLIIS